MKRRRDSMPAGQQDVRALAAHIKKLERRIEALERTRTVTIDDTTLAKGGIVVYDGSKFTILAVGANTTKLTADSAQSSGIKWA